MAIYCPNCGIELPDGVSFCDACGTPVRNLTSGTTYVAPAGGGATLGSVACSVCGASALPGEAFCDNCGTPLLGAADYAPAASPQPAAASPEYNPSLPAAASPPVSAARPRAASLVVTSPPPPATIPIPERPEMIVGRSDPQSNSFPDVDLGPYGGLDMGVSRRHFRLTRTGDQFYIEDLGAMNGTVVNGQKLPPYTLQPIRPSDRITLGKMEMRFELA